MTWDLTIFIMSCTRVHVSCEGNIRMLLKEMQEDCGFGMRRKRQIFGFDKGGNKEPRERKRTMISKEKRGGERGNDGFWFLIVELVSSI